MSLIFIIVQIIFLLLFLAFFVFFLTQFYQIFFRGYAPFISTKRSILNLILDELHLHDGAVAYELGCGQAGFMRALHKRYPRIKLVGVEHALIPYLIAGIQTSLTRTGVRLLFKNIFDTDLSNADMIYCYLNPEMMAQLETKVKAETKPGTQVVSYQFSFPNIKPEKVLEPGKHDKIYFYRT